MTEFVQVMTTTDSEAEAQRIADALVTERLAGCVQIIGPISSTYIWEGKVERAQEWLCLIKSSQDRYKELEAAIKRVHSYDVPEILATPVVEGNEGYLLWLRAGIEERSG